MVIVVSSAAAILILKHIIIIHTKTRYVGIYGQRDPFTRDETDGTQLYNLQGSGLKAIAYFYGLN